VPKRNNFKHGKSFLWEIPLEPLFSGPIDNECKRKTLAVTESMAQATANNLKLAPKK